MELRRGSAGCVLAKCLAEMSSNVQLGARLRHRILIISMIATECATATSSESQFQLARQPGPPVGEQPIAPHPTCGACHRHIERHLQLR